MLTLRIQTKVLPSVHVAQAVWVQKGHVGGVGVGPAFRSRDLFVSGVEAPRRQDHHPLCWNCFLL